MVNILPFDLNHREMLSNTLHFRCGYSQGIDSLLVPRKLE